MTLAYDLFVIGSGTAATVASHRMAAAGWKVAVADYRPFGGTCALRGCDPKKVLVGAIQTIDDVRRMTGRGVVAPEAHIAWRELIAFKRGFTVPVPAKQERQYGDKKIAMHHGAVRFASRNTLEVEGNVVEARHVLIATGAKAAPLPRPEIPLEESERP
jgi:glutathione reductase (NADPH)